MAEKKISFGFKQVKKQPILLPIKHDDDKEKKNGIELIQCLEGQTIKLVHEKQEEKPLVIPLLNSQKTSSALAALKNLKNVLTGDEEVNDANQKQQSNAGPVKSASENGAQLSLEQRVIKELLNEAKNIDADDDNANEKFTLPLAADKISLDGLAKESSIDDYDKIPISQFGLAMLRGMGLKDEEIKAAQSKEPELRPKGMGLGADKVVKKQKLLVAPAANETLEIKKNAYVRILGGKHKDLYGQIEGLDDHACRVIVRLALGGNKEAFNEFMVQAVSKQEYQQYGKVINSAKYEEYKRKQDEKDAQRNIKTEVKTEVKREKMSPPDRSRENSRSNRESSPRYSKKRDEYASGSRHRSRDRSRSRDHTETNRSRDSKRSPSYDRNRTKTTDRDAQRSRHDNQQIRSTDRHKSHSTSNRIERSKDDKYNRRQQRSPSHSKSSSSRDSDSSNERHNHQKSHHKKSKKKQKKKSSKKYDSSDDDRHIKKKTKKSKRERSRSR